MNVTDLIATGILGTLLSLLVETIQRKAGTSSTETKFLVVALSIIIGTFYVLFKDASWWSTVIAVLAVSQAVYALLIPKSEGPQTAPLG